MDDPLTNDESAQHGPIDPHRPMDFQELCRYLKASPPTIRAYLAEGLREVGFKVGKEWRFLPLEVIEWLKWRQRRKSGGKRKPPHPTPSASLPADPRIRRFLKKHWPR
jgi:Helix-turn-helix domain